MKTLVIYLVLPVLLAFLVLGCEEKSEKQPLNVDKSSESLQKSDAGNNENLSVNSGNRTETKSITDDKLPDLKDQRMIIKTGLLSLETDKYDNAEVKIIEAVKIQGGFISNTKSSVNASGSKSGTITAKVPSDKFDLLVKNISMIGKVMNENIHSNDVTEEYIDLETRIKTQKELEQRLLKLLDEKAVKLSDVIEIEEKLASVRLQIEGIEGKLKLLKSQSDLSTLTINVYEPSMISTSSGGGFFYELGQAVRKGLSGFTGVLAVSISIFIAIIPILIFAYLIYRIIKAVLNRKTKIKAAK